MVAPIDKLVDACRQMSSLASVRGFLLWDQEAMMPAKGVEGRARSMAALARIVHQQQSDPAYGDLLETCAAASDLSPENAAIVRELKYDRERSVKVPEALVVELSETSTRSEHAWAEAKAANAPEDFLPWLGKMVALRRREAEYLGFADSPYDSLLEDYESGLRAAPLRTLFADLRRELVPLLGEILEKRPPEEDAMSGLRFPVAGQLEFVKKVAGDMGLDMAAARIDPIKAHGIMVALHPQDIRITMLFKEDHLPTGLLGTMHEAGHGLYEQGLPVRYWGTPLAEAASVAIHESQSRLYENQIGRSRAFWEHYYPILVSFFPEQLGTVKQEAFLASLNRVRPSLIRTEADEVTYNLHIILRFEIETALFNGGMKVGDIESAWNAGMKDLLGLVPAKPSEGFLQDIHWSAGQMGYFPAYSLGNLRAAQFLGAARRDLPEMEMDIGRGNLLPLKTWLNDKVHRHGRRYSGEEIMARATGEKTSPQPFLAYLRAKYL